MSDRNFFPPYLNKGSKGPAVKLLQILLLAINANQLIVVDGDYGDETAKGVRKLQAKLKVDQDGNFGPLTREAIESQFKLDLNGLPANVFEGENEAVGP